MHRMSSNWRRRVWRRGLDRSHVVFPFDSVIDEYSTAKSGELLCTLQEEQEESAANVGVRARKTVGFAAAFIGFTVMVACLMIL